MAGKQGVGAAVAVKIDRVQGLESSIHDLTLRDGRGVTALIGGSIVGTPQLTRSIEGSSSIQLQIYDPELRWLETSLASQKWDCAIDGLWFRYIGTSKSGALMTLKFEDREAALLRELEGPVKRYAHRGQPNELTRAEFICGLVEEVKPAIPIVCPQLEDPQPIKTERQAKKAAKEAPAKRAPGVGDTKGLTVKGQAPSAEQTELINMALNIANSKPCPFVCKVAVVAALIDETDAGAVQRGNVLAALEPYTKVRNAAEEIAGFLFGEPQWTGVTAVGYHNENPSAPAHVIAQAVQKSATADGSNYAQFVDEARKWVEAHGGGTEGELEAGGSTEKLPRAFEVKAKGGKNGEPETYWDAIQRLAKEVNWRAFVSAGVFYYISEDELSRGAVRLGIHREPGHRTPVNEAVEDVDFDANANKPVGECTVTALAAATKGHRGWSVPPGAVATVAGYGPASLGPGDAPPKEKPKEAIASAVKASTHEGKGRYLAAKIAVPLVGDPAVRKATVSLRKPTRPLPEAAAGTKTVASAGGSSIGQTASAPLGSSSVSGHPELKPGVSEVVNAILEKFPGLQITSTLRPEETGSYHAIGRACDIASGDYGLMNQAAAWINSSGLWQHLVEGIHNPGSTSGESLLSVKNQKKVPYTFWGEPTWGEHANHIHVAV